MEIKTKEDFSFLSQDVLKRIAVTARPYPLRAQKLIAKGEDVAYLREAILERVQTLRRSDYYYNDFLEPILKTVKTFEEEYKAVNAIANRGQVQTGDGVWYMKCIDDTALDSLESFIEVVKTKGEGVVTKTYLTDISDEDPENHVYMKLESKEIQDKGESFDKIEEKADAKDEEEEIKKITNEKVEKDKEAQESYDNKMEELNSSLKKQIEDCKEEGDKQISSTNKKYDEEKNNEESKHEKRVQEINNQYQQGTIDAQERDKKLDKENEEYIFKISEIEYLRVGENIKTDHETKNKIFEVKLNSEKAILELTKKFEEDQKKRDKELEGEKLKIYTSLMTNIRGITPERNDASDYGSILYDLEEKYGVVKERKDLFFRYPVGVEKLISDKWFKNPHLGGMESTPLKRLFADCERMNATYCDFCHLAIGKQAYKKARKTKFDAEVFDFSYNSFGGTGQYSEESNSLFIVASNNILADQITKITLDVHIARDGRESEGKWSKEEISDKTWKDILVTTEKSKQEYYIQRIEFTPDKNVHEEDIAMIKEFKEGIAKERTEIIKEYAEKKEKLRKELHQKYVDIYSKAEKDKNDLIPRYLDELEMKRSSKIQELKSQYEDIRREVAQYWESEGVWIGAPIPNEIGAAASEAKWDVEKELSKEFRRVEDEYYKKCKDIDKNADDEYEAISDEVWDQLNALDDEEDDKLGDIAVRENKWEDTAYKQYQEKLQKEYDEFIEKLDEAEEVRRKECEKNTQAAKDKMEEILAEEDVDTNEDGNYNDYYYIYTSLSDYGSIYWDADFYDLDEDVQDTLNEKRAKIQNEFDESEKSSIKTYQENMSKIEEDYWNSRKDVYYTSLLDIYNKAYLKRFVAQVSILGKKELAIENLSMWKFTNVVVHYNFRSKLDMDISEYREELEKEFEAEKPS